LRTSTAWAWYFSTRHPKQKQPPPYALHSSSAETARLRRAAGPSLFCHSAVLASPSPPFLLHGHTKPLVQARQRLGFSIAARPMPPDHPLSPIAASSPCTSPSPTEPRFLSESRRAQCLASLVMTQFKSPAPTSRGFPVQNAFHLLRSLIASYFSRLPIFCIVILPSASLLRSAKPSRPVP
jgi:hypothetical protein